MDFLFDFIYLIKSIFQGLLLMLIVKVILQIKRAR